MLHSKAAARFDGTGASLSHIPGDAGELLLRAELGGQEEGALGRAVLGCLEMAKQGCENPAVFP